MTEFTCFAQRAVSNIHLFHSVGVGVDNTDEGHCGFVRIRRATMNKYHGSGFEASQVEIRRASLNSGHGFEVDS